jgi:murein DD-endopeptidase MepM/ murein hydrolase activator NlpD
MSLSSRYRTRRPTRRSRGRKRPPRRAPVSTRNVLALRCAGVITAACLIGTGTYFALQYGDLLRLVGEQKDLLTTYEDRITELRTQVDRIVSQKRLDQEQVEQRVNALLQRQDRISLSLDHVEQKQVSTLNEIEERTNMRARRMQSVLADLGIRAGRTTREDAIGGPFIPVTPVQPRDKAFETQLYRINLGREQIDDYRRTLVAVPLRKPVAGEAEMTSAFGVRMHPIFRRLAMHTGIDLHGEVGEPVRATATGKVTIAGRQGGYGNMVEISHGNGLATRFGHLSEISVKVGQFVRIGEMVGRIGSTGLSTGPHLHYETRVNGQAVDPQKFLRAGLSLAED